MLTLLSGSTYLCCEEVEPRGSQRSRCWTRPAQNIQNNAIIFSHLVNVVDGPAHRSSPASILPVQGQAVLLIIYYVCVMTF